MRVIVYGAGGIGSIVGGHLARTGSEVLLITRPGHARAINEHGLRLVTPTDTHILRLLAVTAPDQVYFRPDDVVFLCMKGQNTEEATRALLKMTEDIPIFCFQNGVRNEEITAHYYPRVYSVMVLAGAVYLADGEVMARREPPGCLLIGCYPKGTDELVESVVAKLRIAGFLVMSTPDIMPYKWGKLMANLENAIVAISNTRGGDIAPIVRAARQELRELLTQANIHWTSEEELAKEWPEMNMPLRGRLDVEALSSTWQSLTRRQGTVETEFFNGEVVRLAKKLGRQAPINEALLHITQEMATNHEPPGKYTPVQLCMLLELDPSL